MIKSDSGSKRFSVLLLTLSTFAMAALAQDAPRPLVLTGAIPLPGVHGRIDHLAIDGNGHLFVSALGSNSEQVVDIGGQDVVHVISDIPTPQGVVYSPETNKLFVGSAKGNLYIFDGTSYKLITTIDFHGDVDNLRYNPSSQLVFVGFGDEEPAAIGTVDATNNRRGKDFKLSAHPESFQLEKDGPNIYVNLPDLKQIAAVDRKTWNVTRWPLSDEGNFPMALDEADHRVFVNTRAPAKLLAVNTNTGKVVASLPSVEDCDDIYYDAARKRIYASGGEGFIAVFQQKDADHYALLTKIQTALGARTSGYFGKLGKKGFDRFFLAVPARADHGAEVWIYTVQD
jgi:DNA-binding beta-propeller fold protein YncE